MQTNTRQPQRSSASGATGQTPRRKKKMGFWKRFFRMKPQGFAICFGLLAVGGYLLFAAASWMTDEGPAAKSAGSPVIRADGSPIEGWDRLAVSVSSAARGAVETAKPRPVSLAVPVAMRTPIPAGADEIVVPAGIPALPEQAPAAASLEETLPAPEGAEGQAADLPQAEPEAEPEPEQTAPATVKVTTTGSENLAYWQSVNGDVIGWLKVPTTNINYPVVKGPNTNYYIDKDVYGNYSVNGVIWADSDIRVGSGSQLSNNTVIYGHNWTNYSANPSVGRSSDVMFAQLTSLQHLWVAQQIPYVYFSTAEQDMAWQVFAAFYTDTNLDYILTDPGSTTMEYIIDEAIARSEHIYNVSVSASDKILTLSTCTRRFGPRSDQRFVVMAKLMDGTENLPAVSITANPNPKRPQF